MDIDFSKQKLPKIFKRNNRDCYLDPIRRKLIYITPEETVRQQVISYLLDELKVPIKMIEVEAHLSHYGVKSRLRADIIVLKYDEIDNVNRPLLIIECKAPNVMLSNQTIEQVTVYADQIGADYVFMTNGTDVDAYHYDNDSQLYWKIKEIPEYIQMIKDEFILEPEKDVLPRLTLEEIKKYWNAYSEDFGISTPRDLCIPLINLWECLLYNDSKFPVGKYRMFNVIEDYGLRILSYGNASGGIFNGVYRCFIIEYKGNTEIVSIGISPYVTTGKPGIERTSINVAIDTDDSAHHSLQLIVDDNAKLEGNNFTLYHHGRIGVSNIGSGKIDELRTYVAKDYPELIEGRKFNLGVLTNNRLWKLNDPEVMSVVEKLICYALIRDEYRKDLIKTKKNDAQ